MEEKQSFWDHVDALRAALLKSLAVAAAFAVAAFCFRETLFSVVLAPREADFATYRLLGRLAALAGASVDDFSVQLINTGLARQFIIHMKMALCAGILSASPYMLYQLFRFVSPALYVEERRYVVRMTVWGYGLFLCGVLVSYYLVFPLTFRFLGTYQVSADVENLITLDSYISTLMTLSLVMGIVFEIPILAWLFAKLGFLTASFMRQFRKHAVVVILVIAAVITPTSDLFTLVIVSLPMWLLYEASIGIVARTTALSAERS